MRVLTLILCFTLAACGFRPVYQKTGASIAQLPYIEILNIPDQTGQRLRNLLIDRLYIKSYPTAPLYRLAVHLEESRRDLGIKEDATATRAQLKFTAEYRLVEAGTNRTLLSGQVRSVSSYNILDSEFGTLVTAGDARERGLVTLSDDITTHLVLYFSRK